MRRVASHYIWFRQLYRMHYVELDSQNRLVGIFPLSEEIAGTEFYDGLLIPISLAEAEEFPEQANRLYRKESDGSAQRELFAWLAGSGMCSSVESGDSVVLYLLNRKALSSSELCTDNSRCNGYIQRL